MTRIHFALAAVALTIPVSASAGAIDGACMSVDRQGVGRAVCICIQQVADMTLNSRDQKRAASLFRDPDQAQVVRMSKSDADNLFWARYKAFGDMAATYCAG